MNHVFRWEIEHYIDLLSGKVLKKNSSLCNHLNPLKKIFSGKKKSVGAYEERAKKLLIYFFWIIIQQII